MYSITIVKLHHLLLDPIEAVIVSYWAMVLLIPLYYHSSFMNGGEWQIYEERKMGVVSSFFYLNEAYQTELKKFLIL